MSSRQGLTGGTGDVNPQWLSVAVNQITVNVIQTLEVPIPFLRSSTPRGKSWVMEILKIYVREGGPEAAVAAGENIDLQTWAITFRPEVVVRRLGNPITLLSGGRQTIHAFTALGTYYEGTDLLKQYDLNDGAGHGVLVGADSLFFSMNTSGRVNPSFVDFKVLYRFKAVNIQEYIGIVTSQQ